MAKKNNYDNLPLTKVTLEGSNFNIDDLKVLKVLMDRQDIVTKQYISDVYDTHATLIIGEVRKMLEEIKTELESIHGELHAIKLDLVTLHLIANENRRYIDELKAGFANHEGRIKDIENQIEGKQDEKTN